MSFVFGSQIIHVALNVVFRFGRYFCSHLQLFRSLGSATFLLDDEMNQLKRQTYSIIAIIITSIGLCVSDFKNRTKINFKLSFKYFDFMTK